MLLQYLLSSIVLIVLLFLLWEIVRRRKAPEESEAYRHLKSEYDALLYNKNLLEGKFTEVERQNNERLLQINERDKNIQRLENELAVYNKSKELFEQQMEKKISDLENSRKALENEKNRVTESDRIKKEKEEEERTRIWAMHEEASKSRMREICQKSGLSLNFYENTSLPEGFDPKLKPDFMVRLLNQYVIFDPKFSTAQNISTYLLTQVKNTAIKIKKSDSSQDIYSTVFFIIPGIALQEIKETYYVEDGITFFIIPIEAFEPVLRTLKRLEDYDLADKYDPQDREKIVNTIASLDFHIRYQNATNILTSIRGVKVLEESKSMPDDMIKEVESKREKIRIVRLQDAEIKRLIDNPEAQIKEISKLVAPRKSEISDKDLYNSEKTNI